jgi:hypothetical protein
MGSAYGVDIHPELIADCHAMLDVLCCSMPYASCLGLHPRELHRRTPLNLRHLFPANTKVMKLRKASSIS